ncbi:putative ribonuclease H-like domain-containing protein [Tanacetum coccineum]
MVMQVQKHVMMQNSKDSPDAGFKPSREEEKKDVEDLGKDSEILSTEEPTINQEKDASVNSTNNINTVSPTVNAASIEDNDVDENIVYGCADDLNIPELEDIVYSDDDEDVGAEADMNNLDAFMPEVYVCQPLGFELLDFPDRVYKVEKALYGLHQAPRVWYETLSTYLLDNGFQRGKIDKTLFIRRDKGDILLVQVYVDDIIFGSTKKSLCTEFEKMMHKKFQMSYMGELTFFLGLQVKQKEDGVFISQAKYVTKILKKFGFTNVKTASTPMETQKPLLKDEDGEEVDVHLYRSMIGSLMYLTSSRPDIMFAVCACARYQVNPKVSHLHAVKRIFRYLKGQSKLGLWYPKDSPFDLVAYTNSDYYGASLDRKSTTGGCQFLGCRLISWQYKKQTMVANSTTEAEYVAASSCCGQVLWIQNQLLDYGVSNEKKLIQMIKIHTNKNVADLLTKAFDATVKVKTVNREQKLQALVDGKKIIITEATVRRDLQLEDADGKDNKDKSEQNQSKPTRNGKGKTRVKNESQNQSRISPIQQEKKANESQRTNVDKFSKFKGNLNDQIIVPVPNSSLHCAVCGTPVDGPYCHGCTLVRKKFDEDLLAYCVDNGVFQNFQDTSESSNGHLPPNVYQASCGRRAKLNQSYLARIVESLLKDLQILNEVQPLRQETSNQIQKDQEKKSIAELLAEERLQKANQALNESQSPQEMRIQDLEIQKQHLDKSMSKHWKCGIIYKKQKSLEESEARARSQKIIIDDDDDIWGFYAVHPNTIHTFVSQNVWGKCNLFDINDSYYEKSTSRLAHLAPISPEIVEACVDDDDTDDDDDYDDDFYDCVDIEEDGGEIDLDISKIVDISLRR